MDAHLVTSDNQFGFKQKHSTDLCISTVKSILHYYNYCNSPVYTCFLDASKAFDRVNHWTMFKKTYIKGCANYYCMYVYIFGIVLSNFVYNGAKRGHLFHYF